MIHTKRIRVMSVMMVMLLLMILPLSPALADTAGPRHAGTGANVNGPGTISWTTPDYITADDTNYATANVSGYATTEYLQGTNYGFSIPITATIQGITVTIARSSSGSSNPLLRDSTVYLLKGGAIVGNNKANTGTNWPGSIGTATFGGAADLWGTTWTPGEVNTTTFGVSLSAYNGNNSSRNGSVDYMQITIQYSLPKADTTTAVSCGGGTPVVTYGSSISCVASVTRVSGSNTPTGTVTWGTSGTGSFGTSTYVGASGTLTCTTSYTPTLVAGSPHTITATYAGDANFNGSSGNQAVTVNRKDAAPVITASNKVYDGTTTATIATRALSGVVSGDVVTLTGGTATFATAHVANGITVTGTGFTLTGTKAANYNLNPTTATTTANITPKALTVTGITASNKVYDGGTTATLNMSGAALSGVVGGDAVVLEIGGASGAFINKNVGNGKTVTVSGLTLSGADAGNYSVTPPTTTANITARGLTVTGITASNKVYDGGTTATLNASDTALVGTIGGDDVTLDASGAIGAFGDKIVGNAKTVTVSGLTLSGADAGNYSVTRPTTTANITPKALTVTGITASNKVYDGNTTATLNTSGATLVGVIGLDVVTFDTSGATGAFSDADVGAGKTVTVSGVTLGGADAGNYSVTPPTTTADITPAPTTTTLSSSANPSVFGASVTFTAVVSPSAATGTVQFYADGAPLGSPATLVGGTATVSTGSLAVGTHEIVAMYGGDSNCDPSTSSTLDQVVSSGCTAITSVSFDFGPAAPRVDQEVNFVATATGGTAPINYTWNYGDGSSEITDAATTVHSFPLTNTVKIYNVTLTAANGCSNRAATPKQVTVHPFYVYLPLVMRNAP